MNEKMPLDTEGHQTLTNGSENIYIQNLSVEVSSVTKINEVIIMMKRNILAVVVPALLGVSATNAAEVYNKNGNKVDLYGKVVGGHRFTTSGEHKNADSSYSQIGFKAETQVNDQVTGYTQWESLTKAGKAEGDQENLTRLAYAGIKISDAGSLDYGRNYGIMYDVESYTNMAPFSFGEGWVVGHTDNYMANRSTGLVTYRNNNFFGLVDGLSLGIQYQGKNDRANLKQSNGDGVGISLGYDLSEGFGLISAYSAANRTVNQKADGKGDRAESWAIGAKYGANNIYLATVYEETHNMNMLGNSGNSLVPDSEGNVYNVANKTHNFKVIAQYQFDFGLRPSISYLQYEGKDLNGIGNRDLAKYITTGATFFFNKNFNMYGDYRFNLLNNEDSSTSSGGVDNQATVGLAYQF